MRIGPRSELMTGGLRASPVIRDFPHGSKDSWQHLRALLASQHAREGFCCNLDDHSNIVPSSRRFKKDKSLERHMITDGFGHGDESVRTQGRR